MDMTRSIARSIVILPASMATMEHLRNKFFSPLHNDLQGTSTTLGRNGGRSVAYYWTVHPGIKSLVKKYEKRFQSRRL